MFVLNLSSHVETEGNYVDSVQKALAEKCSDRPVTYEVSEEKEEREGESGVTCTRSGWRGREPRRRRPDREQQPPCWTPISQTSRSSPWSPDNRLSLSHNIAAPVSWRPWPETL